MKLAAALTSTLTLTRLPAPFARMLWVLFGSTARLQIKYSKTPARIGDVSDAFIGRLKNFSQITFHIILFAICILLLRLALPPTVLAMFHAVCQSSQVKSQSRMSAELYSLRQGCRLSVCIWKRLQVPTMCLCKRHVCTGCSKGIEIKWCSGQGYPSRSDTVFNDYSSVDF